MEFKQDEQGFKENLIELMKMQQEANKKNLMLQVSNLIVGIFLFIFMVIIVVLK